MDSNTEKTLGFEIDTSARTEDPQHADSKVTI